MGILDPRIQIGCNADPDRPDPDRLNGKSPCTLQETEERGSVDKHYASVHIPLAKKIPGLKKYDISSGGVGTPAGPSDIHLVAKLYFDSMDALKAGMASPEGRTAGGDLANFADGGADLYLFDTREV